MRPDPGVVDGSGEVAHTRNVGAVHGRQPARVGPDEFPGGRGRVERHDQKAVEKPRVVAQHHGDPGVFEPPRVIHPLTMQRIQPGGDYQRGRQPGV